MEHKPNEQLRRKLQDRKLEAKTNQRQIEIESYLEKYKASGLEVIFSSLPQKKIFKETRSYQVDHNFLKISSQSEIEWKNILEYAKRWIENRKSEKFLFSSEKLDPQHLFLLTKHDLLKQLGKLFEDFNLEDEFLFDPLSAEILAFIDMEDHVRGFHISWDIQRDRLSFKFYS